MAGAPSVPRLPEHVVPSTPENLATTGKTNAVPGSAVGRPEVAISPIRLATSGITLPGSGYSRTVEEFRVVKRHVMANARRLYASSAREAGRVVLVTSAKSGDGKTFTSINLALALAFEKDTSVLLMDGDAYRQSLFENLGISAEKGWIDVVAGGATTLSDVVLNTSLPGLEILPAGRERAEIPELMASRTMKQILDELIRSNPQRYIVIDSLPCLNSTEPSILAGLAGQTIFVVAAHRTSRDELDSSLRLLSGSPSVNLILNNASPSLGEQFKDDGYAYRYGAG
jgi:Mrp family chromosome partitioning ATPase